MKKQTVSNRSEKISEISEIFQDITKEETKAILDANGLEMDEDERLIQVWMTSEDLHSENLCDHGFHIEVGGRKWTAFPGAIPTMLPAKFFQGHKEGEIIKIKFPKTVLETNADWGDEDSFEIESSLILRLELAQTRFRYRSFGTFEECLRRVGA